MRMLHSQNLSIANACRVLPSVLDEVLVIRMLLWDVHERLVSIVLR